MTVLVASTCAPYKVRDGERGADAWLTHAAEWRGRGHEFFLAAEMHSDSDWTAMLGPLERALDDWGWEAWHFNIDDGERELSNGGRITRICTGRNLCLERFNRSPGRWEAVLFLDTDVEPPPDAIERLLEVDRQLVGFHVPTYCLDGPRVVPEFLESVEYWVTRTEPETRARTAHDQRPFPEGADVREHWNTAGALMVRAEAARALRWRWDLAAGSTDDPCFQTDAAKMGFGMTWVRHDVVGQHHPGTIYPLERRGLDLSL